MALIKYNHRSKKNKESLCANCCIRGHDYRDCKLPTTSWGVILVNITSNIAIDHNDSVNIYSSNYEYEPYKSKIIIENSYQDRLLCSTIIDSITFLMISRKHSLGYVEFVRGRYKVEKPMQLTYLFKLMTAKEIDKIKISLNMDDGFNYLWNDMWGKKADNASLAMNRKESMSKYTILKYIGVDGPDIGLEFMVTKIKAEYDINEWGFPKGRRHLNETARECAVREFKEESGYTDSDFKIIDTISPIVEEFFGTNGVKYRHVYYIAELLSNTLPKNDVTDFQLDEVDEITFMNMSTAIETVRPYHEEKIRLIAALAQYYFDVVHESARKLIDNRKNEIRQSYKTTSDDYSQ